MKTVLCCGCFDMLHPGHIAHLKAAKSFGDRLIVALTVDETVNKGAGRPVYTWGERFIILKELRCVDYVVSSRYGADAIRLVRPDVFAKGIDYAEKGVRQDEFDACKEVGAVIMFTETAKMGTSDVIRRIRACEF